MDDTYVITRDVINGLGDKWKDQTKSLRNLQQLTWWSKNPEWKVWKYRLNVGLNYQIIPMEVLIQGEVCSVLRLRHHRPHPIQRRRQPIGLENLLTYDKTFGKNTINFTGLYSAEQTQYTSLYASATKIPNDAFQYYNLGQALGENLIP